MREVTSITKPSSSPRIPHVASAKSLRIVQDAAVAKGSSGDAYAARQPQQWPANNPSIQNETEDQAGQKPCDFKRQAARLPTPDIATGSWGAGYCRNVFALLKQAMGLDEHRYSIRFSAPIMLTQEVIFQFDQRFIE
jgi:hypothetical protein